MASKNNTATDAAQTPPPPPPPADAPKGPNSEPLTSELKDDGTSEAKGNGAGGLGALGQQVNPATQTHEDNGNRTLAKPTLDPGPSVIPGSVQIANPDRSKGEHRYGDANEGVEVLRRTSTGHDSGFARGGGFDGSVVGTGKMAPDNFASGAASDQYHPEGGKTLTEQAAQNAGKARELAPTRDPGGDADARNAEIAAAASASPKDK